jgi:nascent polypeptide-associated complex subunit alpha
MMPGMDPRMMREAMRRMGIKQTEIDASEVHIILADKRIVISDPQVTRINMQGNISYQIAGSEHEESLSAEPEITDDDVATVVSQTGVTEAAAKEALKKNKGDLAKTIMELSG